MANITDPVAIRALNEQIRPLAEAARAFLVECQSLQTQWNAGMGATFTNDSSPVVDGRQATEGVRQLSGAEVNQVYGVLFAMAAAVNAQVIENACVRKLQVS